MPQLGPRPKLDVSSCVPLRNGSALVVPSAARVARLTRVGSVTPLRGVPMTQSHYLVSCLQPLLPQKLAAPLSSTIAVVPFGLT